MPLLLPLPTATQAKRHFLFRFMYASFAAACLCEWNCRRVCVCLCLWVCVCFVHSWFDFHLVVEKCNRLSVVVVFLLVNLFSPFLSCALRGDAVNSLFFCACRCSGVCEWVSSSRLSLHMIFTRPLLASVSCVCVVFFVVCFAFHVSVVSSLRLHSPTAASTHGVANIKCIHKLNERGVCEKLREQSVESERDINGIFL